jgi:ZIP family zinc transporter
MLYLCLIDLNPHSKELMAKSFDPHNAHPSAQALKRSDLFTTLTFFLAILGSYVLDRLSNQLIDRMNVEEKMSIAKTKETRLLAMAVFNAAALAVHNFPEGIANYYSNLREDNVGISLAVAIAIHNIPEGIAVALPLLKSTGSRWWAFAMATLSGLAQPVAALLAVWTLGSEVADFTQAIIFSIVSGIMVYIASVKLYPAALEYHSETSGMWLVAGMAIMAVSLYLLAD